MHLFITVPKIFEITYHSSYLYRFVHGWRQYINGFGFFTGSIKLD